MAVITDLKILLASRGYHRLFVTRMLGQAGDGVFEAGLATLLFFNQQEAATAGSVAVALAIMLAPFTFVGPWAGVFLDRWSRRQVLLMGNVLRAGLMCAIVAVTWTTGVTSVATYALVLIALSVNRFLLAALSASLPRVVARQHLLLANSVTPTLGSIGYGIGIVIGGVIRVASGSDTVTIGSSIPVFLASAFAASRFPRAELGPDKSRVSSGVTHQLRKVAYDLVAAVRYLARVGTPARALAIMGIQRLLYGVVYVSATLLARNFFDDPFSAQGLSTFAVLAAGLGLGSAAAIVATPIAHRWLHPWQWIVVCLALCTAGHLVFAMTTNVFVVTALFFLLGLGAQGTKIAVDTIVQKDTIDDYRGRTFAFYDTIYNTAFITSAIIAALVLPDTGYSPLVFWIMAGAYAAAAWWFARTDHAAKTFG